MFRSKNWMSKAACIAVGTLLSCAAFAQSYPYKPIRWIVGYPAGGGSDNVVRLLATELSAKLGQPVVVENMPGAATAIAAVATAKAAPDGYTLFAVDNATMVFNPLLDKSLPYAPSRDFTSVALYAKFSFLLVVNPSVVPANSVASLLSLAKAADRPLAYASPGIGSPQHLAGELFKERTGAALMHVPYKGTAPLTQDLLGGHIGISFIGASTGIRQVRAGKLRALGVADPSRLPSMPDVPTLAEAGVRDMNAYAWQGVVVPAHTPAPVIDKLSAALQEILKDSKFQARMRDIGAEPMEGGRDAMKNLIATDLRRWSDVIQKRGIALER